MCGRPGGSRGHRAVAGKKEDERAVEAGMLHEADDLVGPGTAEMVGDGLAPVDHGEPVVPP